MKPNENNLGVADILKEHIADYRVQYPLWPEHRKIVYDILNCRTARLGGHIDRCDNCGASLPASSLTSVRVEELGRVVWLVVCEGCKIDIESEVMPHSGL